ncbi:MAG: amidohydrolase family protein, partial [Alphaproteobacteria bacterium]
MPEGSESRMIIRARTVVTMDGAPVNNGAIAVSENRIIDVGEFGEIQKGNAGEILDLGEQTLLPGLINAHCHLDYTSLRGKIPPRKSFAGWIRAINAEKATLSPKDYVNSINDGFTEARRFGTSTIANLTAFPELIPQIQPPIRTCWFPELIDIRAPERAQELVDVAIESVDSRPSQSAPWGLAPHALFTASKELFRSCEEMAHRDNILLTTHLAESRDEMQMFRDASGPLYEFLKNIGRPMDDCGSKAPLELFLDLIGMGGSANCSWIIVHLNELAESDFELLERS